MKSTAKIALALRRKFVCSSRNPLSVRDALNAARYLVAYPVHATDLERQGFLDRVPTVRSIASLHSVR